MGSWITCEETVERAGKVCSLDHGYNFEVPATAKPHLAKAVALKAMGRFNHEAIAVDPKTGIVYQTEDRHDGLLYRFIPNVKGQLARGGKLQALVVEDAAALDTRNWEEQRVQVGDKLTVRWLEMDEVESPKDDLRQRGFAKGAARFARGEGMWYAEGSIYFACTNGGAKKAGQVWKLTGDTLELFAEPNDKDLCDNCDNLTVAPWGDVVLCEDGGGEQFLVGITPAGRFYKLGRNAKSNSEFAGATFSPDGSTLFVNIQHQALLWPSPALGKTGSKLLNRRLAAQPAELFEEHIGPLHRGNEHLVSNPAVVEKPVRFAWIRRQFRLVAGRGRFLDKHLGRPEFHRGIFFAV